MCPSFTALMRGKIGPSSETRFGFPHGVKNPSPSATSLAPARPFPAACFIASAKHRGITEGFFKMGLIDRVPGVLEFDFVSIARPSSDVPPLMPGQFDRCVLLGLSSKQRDPCFRFAVVGARCLGKETTYCIALLNRKHGKVVPEPSWIHRPHIRYLGCD